MSETQKKNGMAVAALVLGIISLALFWMGLVGIICGVLAVIFGIVALNKVKADPDLAPTKGKAKGGLIMGIIGIVLGAVIWILAIMAAKALMDAGFEQLNNIDQQEINDMMNELNN